MDKNRLHRILQPAETGDTASRRFDIFIITLILLNILAVILESVESLRNAHAQAFHGFELFSVAVFTLEYLLRVWSCTSDARYASPVKGRLRFMTTPMAVIDLLAVLPFYICFISLDLRFLRIFRLFRIFRVVKLGRYLNAISLFGRVFKRKKEELVLSLLLITALLVLSSCIVYYFENPVQPAAFPSIPASMWWAVTTLSTVGYGDVVPITVWGRISAACIALLGIAFFALPAGIVSSGFVEEMRRDKGRGCPHCGRELEC